MGKVGIYFRIPVLECFRHRRLFEYMNAPIAFIPGTNYAAAILNETQLGTVKAHLGHLEEQIEGGVKLIRGTCEGCSE